jgi:signal peptidase I
MRPGAKRPLGFGAVGLLGALVLLAAAVRRARLEPMLVRGESMLPTLAPGQRIAVAPIRRAPRRGDLVVVRRPEREVVKRVVGLPGERVRLLAGRLEIDGQPVPEPYAEPRSRPAGPAQAADPSRPADPSRSGGTDATAPPDLTARLAPEDPLSPEDLGAPPRQPELDLRLGVDEFAVLGDRRDRSTDSRRFGPVRRNDLIAIVRFAYWPPRRMRPPK